MNKIKKPTIAELEQIMSRPPEVYKVEILPNGEVRSEITEEYIVKLESLRRENAELKRRIRELEAK